MAFYSEVMPKALKSVSPVYVKLLFVGKDHIVPILLCLRNFVFTYTTRNFICWAVKTRVVFNIWKFVQRDRSVFKLLQFSWVGLTHRYLPKKSTPVRIGNFCGQPGHFYYSIWLRVLQKIFTIVWDLNICFAMKLMTFLSKF